MTALAICLAILGAVCYALAAHTQHAAVRAATRSGGRPALRRLVRHPRWLAGFALIGTGATLHAAGLGMAPLTVVQPVGVLAVVLIAALHARTARLGGGAIAAIAGTTVAVAGFVALAAGAARGTQVTGASLARTGLLAATTVAVLALAARALPGRARCLLLAAGGGVAYGFVSVATRAVLERFAAGGWAAVPWPAVLGIGAALALGGTLIQLGYASGPPTVVVASLTVVDPLFAAGIGAALLGETAAIPVPVAAAQVALAAVAATGVALLARFHPDAAARASIDGFQLSDPRVGSTADNRQISVEGFQMSNSVIGQRTVGRRPTDGRLRLVIGADTFPPDVNGAAAFSCRLATGLAARGHEVHVLCPEADGIPDVSTMDGVTVHRVAARRTPFHPTFRVCTPWRAGTAADSLLAELAPDLVHIQSHFVVGRALSLSATRYGIPLVATNHFMPENLFGYVRLPAALHGPARRLAWRDLRRVYRRAAAVTAPTPRAVELLRANGVDGSPLSCGIDLERFATATRTPSPAPTVLFVGRLDAEKRVDELLRAAALLPAGTAYRIELVGQGSRRGEWERLAARLGIAARVTFRGYVPDAELPAAYASSDIFCIPGIAELQSLVTMEAMAAGKPVLAADAMALPHLVRDGENGWLYQPGDVPGLSRRLAALLSDAGLRARMGEASRRLIARHDQATTLTGFEDLYHGVLGIRRPEPATLVAA